MKRRHVSPSADVSLRGDWQQLYGARGAFQKHLWALKSKSSYKFYLWIKSTSFNVWVRYLVWNFKGPLWNSTQNIFPIHWKIRFLYKIEILGALRFKSSYAFLKRPHVAEHQPASRLRFSGWPAPYWFDLPGHNRSLCASGYRIPGHHPLNTLRTEQNGRYFADDIFKCILLIGSFIFCFKFHWGLFIWVRLTVIQHWFR